MTKSDFVWVNFNESFNPGNSFAFRNFFIDGTPISAGYLLIQVRDVDIPQSSSESPHQIRINGIHLPDFDIAFQEGNQRWTTWMDEIPRGFLQQGENSISITRGIGSDLFEVASVAINWREWNGFVLPGPNYIQASFLPSH